MCSFEKQLLYFDLNKCYDFIVHGRKPQRPVHAEVAK